MIRSYPAVGRGDTRKVTGRPQGLATQPSSFGPAIGTAFETLGAFQTSQESGISAIILRNSLSVFQPHRLCLKQRAFDFQMTVKGQAGSSSGKAL